MLVPKRLMPSPFSCLLVVVTLVMGLLNPAGVSAQSDCVDTDGDGWGWDGRNSCRMSASAECIDTDGDGWGWDGFNSCLIKRIVTDCIDEDGDGWGWNGVSSCVVEPEIVDPPKDKHTIIESIDDLSVFWGQYPLIADHVGKRVFLSVPESYQAPGAYEAALVYQHSASGYTIHIEGLPVGSGEQLARTIVIGEAIPVVIMKSDEVVMEYTMIISGLPILQLDAATIVDEPKMPGTFRWVDGKRAVDSGKQNMGIEIRGATSQRFDKKSFSIEVRKENKPEKSANFRFFNARNDDDWIADAAYRDQTFVRNLVSHDLYNDMRPYAFVDSGGEETGQATIAGNLTEVILNGHYNGLYVVEERVDRKLLSLAKIDVPEDDSGDRWDLVDFSLPENGSALYKAVTNNADFRGVDSIETDFEQKYPDSDDIARFEPLRELINFVVDSDDAAFAAQIGERIDLQAMADFWVLRLVTGNVDTLNKNYYIARNESAKWFFVPWDFDATFGMSWDGAELYRTVRYFKPSQSLLLQRLIENPSTGFAVIVQARWQQLRATLLTVDTLTARFRGYLGRAGLLVDAVAEHPRNRDKARWPNSGHLGAGEPQLGQLDYLQQWITERLAFVDRKVAAL